MLHCFTFLWRKRGGLVAIKKHAQIPSIQSRTNMTQGPPRKEIGMPSTTETLPDVRAAFRTALRDTSSALMLLHMQKSYGLCSKLLPRVLLSSHDEVSMCRHHHAKISNYGLAGVVGQICQLMRCRSARLGRQESNALLQTRECIDNLRQLGRGHVSRS